jgi:hypothetical protein
MLDFFYGIVTTLVVEIILLAIYTHKQINGGN